MIDVLNITTMQIASVRDSLKTTGGILIIGKNAIARLAIKILTEDLPKDDRNYELQQKYKRKENLQALLPLLKNKIGWIFTDTPYTELKNKITKEGKQRPAKAGAISPVEIYARAGPTYLDPGETDKFQIMGIETKIQANQLQIKYDTLLCKQGEVVSNGVSNICNLLKIRPFVYSIGI